MAAELGLDVLRDEVDSHQVVTSLPGDDDVSIPEGTAQHSTAGSGWG